MKDSFLNKIADYIKQQNLLSNDVKIILPNKRASLFLKKELINLINTPTFLPQFLSIEEFTQQLTDLTLLDNLHLQFNLYEVYSKIIPVSERDCFDKFIQWAPIVLQDFNEIDAYLIDAKKLYTNLSDLKRIENWTPESDAPTSFSLNYLKFFKTLNRLHKEFSDNLLQKQQAYQGLIYREAVNNISLFASNIKSPLIFAGFNALNKAEEVIIQELLEQNKAQIFWDLDTTFFNTKHLSSKLITHYKNTWPYYKDRDIEWESTSFKDSKNIQFIGSPKNILQFKVAGQILEDINKSDDKYNDTALVLGNEDLLNVALESLPDSVEQVNITMGYALKNTLLANLFSILFEANIKAIKFNKAQELYYKDVINILRDAYFQKLDTLDVITLKQVINAIHKNNLIFVDYKVLKSSLSLPFSELDFIFKPTNNNITEFLSNCLQLIDILKENTNISNIDKEYLYRFYNLFVALESLENNYHFIKDLKTLQHFYNSLLRNEKLFFEGEPLSGLQILGMLETRTLDFENVIITSVNEGILPANKSTNSFIPFAIKKAFGLPTYSDKEAIFSYHFFRLLQRAKNIYLIYNTEVDGFGASEKSRFLTQLELLKPTEIKKYLASSNLNSELKSAREIKVNQKLKEGLKELAEKGISPSATALYLKNPLDFYYSKILKIREQPQLEETIAYNTFGTVIHDALYQLYVPYLNQNLTEKSLENIAQNTAKALKENFKKTYKGGTIAIGKNKLYFEMAKQYIQKLVSHELALLKKHKSIKILALEEPLNAVLNIPNISYPVKIKGIADRIDSVDGNLRIIDYKTGSVDLNKLKIYNFDNFLEDEKHILAMQLLMYVLMYSKTNDVNQEIEAGIISFKKLNNYVLKINFKSDMSNTDFNITNERLKDFEEALQQLMQSIFNIKIFTENIQNK
ncbi:MAG: PD-(D/E)XK nuclease family protein [Flavobacteriaceae bacterium]